MGWSLKGGIFGLLLGFIFALILEGFLIIGGRTAVTEILGWQNAPKPLLVALEAGRAKLVNVLGVQKEIESTRAQTQATKQSVLDGFQSLPPAEAADVREMICTP
jgi:hypothetical protein